ncbi:MAG TPA: two-component regulator propeller domain-containing protein [Verrucomicrobiae bacterium]|nr:two-component regulator propeller domain-containing protein [Verrucomicrobiae bacterium]
MSKFCRALPLAGLLLCGLLFAPPVTAGMADRPGSRFLVDSWTVENGLPDGEVISVVQTHDGYLWLGTLHGLVRFDGNRFLPVFDEENTPGLNSDWIIYLFEDSHTNFWVGTDITGVGLVQDGKIKNFEIGRPGQEGRLTSVCEDAASNVWFYTADSCLARYQNGKMETVNFNFSTPPTCRMIAAEKSGALWVADASGMFSIRPENFNPQAIVVDEPIQLKWPAERLDFILAGRNGGIWRLMDGRVQKWKDRGLEKDFGEYPWGNASVKAACEDQDGNLIVGTLGAGVFWYDANGKYERISKEQGLSSAYVLSLCMDREGNLWVGTDGDGLDRVKKRIFNAPLALHPWPAQSLSEDALGGLWMTYGALGGSYWLSNSLQDFHVGHSQNAWTVLADRGQHVWIGTREEGLFEFQTNHFESAAGAESLRPWVYALFQARNGQLWAGTQNGLACWNGNNWKMFTTQDGLSENAVRAIAEDAGGNLWVGTDKGGLNCFKDGKFTAYQQTADGLPGNDISALYLDKDGVLWIGTAGHGLARFHNGKWTQYSTSDGLASDSVGYIIEDDAGNLWIGSNAGLMRIEKKSLDDYVPGTTNVLSCRTYGEADGLPTRECSIGAQPAAIRTRDGQLWFPTVKGFVSVNPAELKPNPRPPAVMIESVRVDGREQRTNLLASTWPQSITIAPGNRQLVVQLEIHYTALNFTAPGQVRFKYRLEGRETVWTEVRDTRAAYYSEVPPGHYRFHVIACNEDGVWNENGSYLDITVQPQFWETGWFRIAAVAGFLGLIIAAVRYLSTQKLQRQLQVLQQREALEQERSRIARDLHDQLGANLTQLALLGELAEADKDAPEEIEGHVQQISETARETTGSLDEIVWAVNPANDTLDGLVNYACKYAQDYFTLAGLRYRADVPAQLPATTIPPEVRHNVFLAFKEAVNNVVKHARASEARIRLTLHTRAAGSPPDSFTLEIEDNGRGLGSPDAGAAATRNGLRNMRKRMEDIGGAFEISSSAGKGTCVCLRVPLNVGRPNTKG